MQNKQEMSSEEEEHQMMSYLFLLEEPQQYVCGQFPDIQDQLPISQQPGHCEEHPIQWMLEAAGQQYVY